MKPFLMCTILAFTFAPYVRAAESGDIASLGWLAGSWCASSDGATMEEHWTIPHGGILLGIHRDVAANGRPFFEFLRIQADEQGLVYYASPLGREPTPFRLVEVSGERAVFENLEHDFPQRLIYARTNDELRARIEGEVSGEIQGSEWVWSKEACDRVAKRH